MSDAAAILADVAHWDQAFAAQHGLDPQLAALADAQNDEVLADWIRATGDPVAARGWLANVRELAEAGEAEEATRLLERFHTNRVHAGNMLARHSAALVRVFEADAEAKSAQASAAGSSPKRREWADVIAAQLTGETKADRWASIPQSFDPATVENWGEELEYWRDGDTLYCWVNGVMRTLARSTFFARYLKRDTVTPLV